jgi:hypothetical protein
MSFNDILIGRNVTIQLVDGTGAVIQLTRLKSWDVKPRIKELNSMDFNGINRHKTIYEGYEGSLEFEAIDDSVQAYFAVQQASFLNGDIQQYNTVTETFTFANGGTAQYLYSFVDLMPDDFGTRQPDEYIFTKAKFYAAQMIKLK